ncbi:MAG: hypothetical protein F6K47_01030 [Symploca sp. SIO2E6]|nr:hypothetical protein [Symploca sp. SIO2E6]
MLNKGCSYCCHPVSQDLYRVLDLHIDKAGDLNRYLNRDPDINRVLKQSLDRDLYRNLDRNLYLYLNRVLDLYLNRVLDRNLYQDINRVLDRNLDRDINRTLDLDLNQFLYRYLNKTIEIDKASDFLILYFPLLFLIVIYHILLIIYQAASKNRGALDISRQESEAISRKYQEKIDEIYPLYFYLVLLDERQAGRIPAWEGIRLVREKVD